LTTKTRTYRLSAETSVKVLENRMQSSITLTKEIWKSLDKRTFTCIDFINLWRRL